MRLWLSCIVGLCACSDPTPPCDFERPVCDGSNELLVCSDGVEETRDCDEYCAGLNQVAVGCAHLEAGDECLCQSAWDECPTSGETSCVSFDVQATCEEGTWSLNACWEHCGATSIPLGCFFDVAKDVEGCVCSEVGEMCEPDEPALCVSPSEVAACIGGEWAVEPCSESCDGGGSCVFVPGVFEGVCVCDAA